ncbi:MAG: gliding motility-associated C-terminal domain-containing protein [Flavobacteriales bacterium]
MNSDKDIKDLLNSKLDNFESPVRPELWQNIASQVGTSAASGAGASGSIFSSTIGKIIIAAAVLTGVVTTLYFTNNEKSEKIVVEQTSIAHSDESEKAIIEEEKTTTLEELSASSDIQNTKETLGKNSKPQLVAPPTPDNFDPKSPGDNPTPPASDKDKKPSTSIYPEIGNDKSKPNDSAADSGKSTAIEKEEITAIFSVKAADPENLKFFLFSSNIGNLSYNWTIDDEVKSTENNFSITFDEQGIYNVKLEVTDLETGEQATTSQEIKAYKPIRFEYPNAFSPGQNGKNDKIDFALGCENESKLVSVQISDMNGSLIYKSENEFVWDGRNAQGSICPAGPYIYSVIAIDQFGEAQSKSGRIQLFSE